MQILRGGTNVQNDNIKFKGEECRGVLEPIDEIYIWKDRMERDGNPEMRQYAAEID